ncbi:oligosaccharide flippase family protein [Nocardioides lijunqiniae]|uniref:oligosaccharide flippase family protein n=1 Tax=Nocardioides lijunqiniae TaxID=2760832 RepID=UPI001877E0E0|nr:oligosaccharide flippase family protein [Nocardioides lijunqiniae]
MTTPGTLGARVRTGIWWSALNNLTLRLGTLVTGILLARLLDPEAFGVFAIALTVQTALMTLSELGLAADLIRHGDVDRRGPTIATLSLVSSGFLTVAVLLAAPAFADFFAAPEATAVIRVMALTLLLAGIGVVPFARLQRDLRQRELFHIELVAFVLSTGLALGLAVAGWGAISIAIGRLVSQTAVVVLQFVLTRTRPRVGWDRSVAWSGLRFGLPLSLAGLLSLGLLNVDNVAVGRLGGVTVLGLYSIAFNLSSWPSSIVGTAIRAVAMPAFAEIHRSGTGDATATLARACGLTWAVAVPMSVGLAVLAHPVVTILYGERWAAAATALVWLAPLGALRILIDVWVAYLTAHGRSLLLLSCQLLWFLSLVPAMWWAVQGRGLAGAGLAHVAVASLVAVPAFLVALRIAGVGSGPVVRALGVPIAAAVPTVGVGVLAVAALDDPWLQLSVAGLAMSGVYALAAGPHLRRLTLDDVPADRSPPPATASTVGSHRAA